MLKWNQSCKWVLLFVLSHSFVHFKYPTCVPVLQQDWMSRVTMLQLPSTSCCTIPFSQLTRSLWTNQSVENGWFLTFFQEFLVLYIIKGINLQLSWTKNSQSCSYCSCTQRVFCFFGPRWVGAHSDTHNGLNVGGILPASCHKWRDLQSWSTWPWKNGSTLQHLSSSSCHMLQLLVFFSVSWHDCEALLQVLKGNENARTIFFRMVLAKSWRGGDFVIFGKWPNMMVTAAACACSMTNLSSWCETIWTFREWEPKMLR